MVKRLFFDPLDSPEEVPVFLLEGENVAEDILLCIHQRLLVDYTLN